MSEEKDRGYLHTELKREFCKLVCRSEEIFAQDIIESAVRKEPDWGAILAGLEQFKVLLDVKEKLKCRCPIE